MKKPAATKTHSMVLAIVFVAGVYAYVMIKVIFL